MRSEHLPRAEACFVSRINTAQQGEVPEELHSLVSVTQAAVMTIASMGYFYSSKESSFPGSARGMDPNVLGLKWPTFPPHQCNLCSFVFQGLCSFHGGLLAPSIPSLWLWLTLFLYSRLWLSKSPTPTQRRVFVPPGLVIGPRGLIGVSSGAERADRGGLWMHGWFLP